MKRLLSITLLIAMLCTMLSLSVVAVEPVKVSGFAEGASILDDRITQDFGVVILGKEENIIDVPIFWENFSYPSGAASPDAINAEVMNNMKLYFTDEDTAFLFGYNTSGNYDGVTFDQWTRNTDAVITLTGKNIGPAKGYLYVVYDDRVNPPTTSKKIPIKGEFVDPTINKEITAIRDYELGSGRGGIRLNGQKIQRDELETTLNYIRPGDELVFALDSDLFDWNPDITHMYSAVRKSTMDNNQISLVKRVVAGSNIIEDAHIENIGGSGAHVVVRFKEDYKLTEPRDFDLTIALAKDKISHVPTTIRLTGTYDNEIIEAYAGTDYIFVGDNIVIEAKENVRGVVIDLGHGAKLTTNLFEGKKYFIRANDILTKADRDIMDFYPMVKKALTIYSKNILENSPDAMEFDLGRDYYVYDADGILLGTTHDKLPFRNKYYFALEELTIETDFNEVTYGYDANDATVFDDNINMNPSTGGADYYSVVVEESRKGEIGVAVIALAAMAFYTKKKSSSLKTEMRGDK